MAQNEGAVGIGKALGRFESGVEEWVGGLSGCVFGHLHQHRRHQIKCLMDSGKLFENARHAVVVLEGMHARPWKLVFAGDQVLIKRLVHVPEKAQVDLGHLTLV